MQLTREEIEEGLRRGDRTLLRGHDLKGLDLSYLDLSGMDLQQARLIEADLTGSKLRRANLRQALLVRTKCIEADLSEADLSDAMMHGIRLSPFVGNVPEIHDFKSTTLWRAKLNGAHLRFGWLNGVDLREANLQGADLDGATMYSAQLCGTDLRATNVELVIIKGAIYNQRTRWPEGLDPVMAGAILVQD